MENAKFGLLGKTLKHSFSKDIHAHLADYSYSLIELEEQNLQAFVQEKAYKGYNVTIPYKQRIMQYLDSVDARAQAIGSVNTVVERGGKLIGYNTDFNGMAYMLESANISLNHKVVMILGSGGTSCTAFALAQSLGAKNVITVSRTGKVNYQNCYQQTQVQVIINTTPVGTFPDTESCPIDITKFPNLVAVADVVYNPLITKLTYNARQMGLKHVNGLTMLVAQAKCASELFTGKSIDNAVIEDIVNEITKKTQNVVLIGMPGSGKSSIGKSLAKLIGREFIDTDTEIEKLENMPIPQIFTERGEEYFRKVESRVLSEVCSLSGKVIATGGGVVTKPENKFSVQKNGKVVYVERSLDKLVREGRPLSKDLESVQNLFNARKDAYSSFADCTVSNDKDLQSAIKGVMELL